MNPRIETSLSIRRCLLLADDPVATGPLVDGAAERGLDLTVVEDPAAAMHSAGTAEYRIVAIQLAFGASDPPREAALAELARQVRAQAPDATLLGVGVTGSTTERTAAGRIGVDLYVEAGAGPDGVLDAFEQVLRNRFHAVLLDLDEECLPVFVEAAEPLNGSVTFLDDSFRLFDELERLRPDLLLLRHRPVGFNVVELIRALRVSSQLRGISVLVAADGGDAEFELTAYAAGADAVVPADVSSATLRARMRSLLARRSDGRTGPAKDATAEEDAATRAADVPSVVVVEDDPSLAEMMEYSIGNRGHRIDLYTDGREALTQLLDLDTRGTRPVVLLDVDLPGLDGFGVLRELSRRRPGQFQVIITTVHSSEAAQVLALQTGAIDYIVKPIRMPVLLAKVQRLLELEAP